MVDLDDRGIRAAVAIAHGIFEGDVGTPENSRIALEPKGRTVVDELSTAEVVQDAGGLLVEVPDGVRVADHIERVVVRIRIVVNDRGREDAVIDGHHDQIKIVICRRWAVGSGASGRAVSAGGFEAIARRVIGINPVFDASAGLDFSGNQAPEFIVGIGMRLSRCRAGHQPADGQASHPNESDHSRSVHQRFPLFPEAQRIGVV